MGVVPASGVGVPLNSNVMRHRKRRKREKSTLVCTYWHHSRWLCHSRKNRWRTSWHDKTGSHCRNGHPASVSAQGRSEYLNYSLSETDDQALYGITRPYYVRLVDGRVESYGRTGDFDSTKTPTVRLESDQTIKQDVQVKGSGDLYTELKKLKELKDSGVITEEEFQAQKKRLLEKH